MEGYLRHGYFGLLDESHTSCRRAGTGSGRRLYGVIVTQEGRIGRLTATTGPTEQRGTDLVPISRLLSLSGQVGSRLLEPGNLSHGVGNPSTLCSESGLSTHRAKKETLHGLVSSTRSRK